MAVLVDGVEMTRAPAFLKGTLRFDGPRQLHVVIDEPIDDPGAVLEDDVAAVLAEGAALQADADASEAAQTEESAPDGAVPNED